MCQSSSESLSVLGKLFQFVGKEYLHISVLAYGITIQHF